MLVSHRCSPRLTFVFFATHFSTFAEVYHRDDSAVRARLAVISEVYRGVTEWWNIRAILKVPSLTEGALEELNFAQ